MLKKYETMLVTTATLDEEASAALVGKFRALMEANGTVDAVDEWGKRRLAYPINKEEEGVYTLFYFSSGVDFPAEFDRVCNITDGVLRYQTIVRPETAVLPAEKKAEEPPVAAPAEAAAEVPAEAVTEAPAETAAEAPTEAEAEAPAEILAEVPAEAEAEVPVEAEVPEQAQEDE